ncbi:MAG: ribose 5-phosphate isomerase B [Candidatus Omnitrophica bacterium]|nr:ribose 5-phosphate isomerase B [Candidatus Omnitrophota bacterium]
MRVVVGADHGGYALKRRLLRWLARAGYRGRDVGTHSAAPCDYPRYAAKVAQAVAAGRADRGLLVCKSGAGMAIAANKFPGVRAVVAHTLASARHARRHNDANVLVLGAVGLPPARAERIVAAWLAEAFDGGRHARRVRQIRHLEQTIHTRKGPLI